MRQLKNRWSTHASEFFTSFISSTNTPKPTGLCAEDSQRAEAEVKGQRPGADGEGCYLSLQLSAAVVCIRNHWGRTDRWQSLRLCFPEYCDVTVSSQVKRTEKLKATYRRSFQDMEEPIPSLVNTRESALLHTLSWLLGNNPWQERPAPQN